MRKLFYIIIFLIIGSFLITTPLTYVQTINQSQIDQMAGVLQSLQNILNQLKQKVTDLLTTPKAQAQTELVAKVKQSCAGETQPCYTSLSAWEAAYGGINFGACAQGDLVCADKIATAQIDGVWTSADTTAVTIGGWTTDATHYIRIYTTAAARHQGKWDTGKYRLEVINSDIITVNESYTQIEGLQISVDGTANWMDGVVSAVVLDDVRISYSIIRSGGTGNNGRGVYLSNVSSISIKVFNNIVYDFITSDGGECINVASVDGNGFVYNNTVYNCRKGFVTGWKDIISKNNISYNNTDNYFGTFNTSSTDNLSGPTQTDAPGTNPRNSTTVSFVDEANKDFHLASNDAGAKDSGADLSANANLAFSDDIDGNSRPSGTSWDIGADEASGGALPTYQCSDGLDNDSDGLIDYPNDSGCSATTDNDEYNVPITDTVPPVISAGSPTGALSSGTTQTTLSVSTDENSTCKYGTIPNTSYASITDTFTTTGGTSHTQTIAGLTNGTSYNYYIRCQDATGNANTADYTISFSVASPSSDTQAPTIPAGLTATPTSSSQINLSWTASTDNVGVTGYKIYRCQGSGCTSVVQIATSPTNSYSDTGLTASTTYSYAVSAYDAAGNNSGQSTSTSVTTKAPPLAFPGAEGFGANSIGGRGGTVIKVTNLNDSGSGSFRAAVTTSGSRIIVFNVSGIINLISDINIYNPYITIAGQTSPGGILITGRKVLINTHDVIIQHMRFRVGTNGIAYKRDSSNNIIYYNQPQYNFPPTGGVCQGNITTKELGYPCAISGGADPETLDSLSLLGKYWDAQNEAYNIIIDHSSIGWGVDETIDISGGITNSTVQWSIISEGLNKAGHPKGEHSKGLMISGKYQYNNSISLHHNYIAHNTGRNPLIYSPEDSYNNETIVDVVNNVIYNWKGGLSPLGEEIPKINWVHNYVKPGIDSHPWSYEVILYARDQIIPRPLSYVFGNIGSSRLSQSDPQWNVGWYYWNQLADTAWQRTTPWTAPAVTTAEMSPSVANSILSAVGATAPVRDSVDTKIINDFANGTGTFRDNVIYPDDFPIFTSPTPPADNDNDGMADNWETSQGLNATVNDSALDNDTDGYTNIEEYLYYLSLGATVDTTLPSTPTGLTLTAVSASQINLSWTASTDNVGVTGYRIYRCQGTGCTPSTQIATSATNSYSNTGLTALTAYTYAVSAYDSANNESVKSSSVSATTQSPTPQCSDTIDNDSDGKIDYPLDPDCSSLTDTTENDTTPPTISSVISTTLTSTTARIDWTTNESATSQVEYGFTTQYGASSTLSTTLTTSHSVLLSNLSPDNTTYNYRVRSKDFSNNEVISINRTFITPGLTDIIPPASTTNLTANNITQTSVDLVTWTAAGDDGNSGTASSFDIRYTTQEMSENTWNNSSVIKATGEPTPNQAGSIMNYTLVGLTPNTTYKVALKTLDEVPNQSLISNIVTFTTLAAQTTSQTATSPSTSSGGGGGGGSFILSDTTPPPQITDLKFQGADKQIRLTWKNPVSSDYVRTIVVRKPFLSVAATHATSTKDGQIVYEGMDKEYTDINLKNNETYLYSIFTIDRVLNYSLPATTTAKTIEGRTSIEDETKEQSQTETIKPQIVQIPINYFKTNLYIGIKNKEIEVLQKVLNDEGVYPENIISGYFGPLTEKAAIAFQEKHNIPATGFVGPLTRAKLNELYGKKVQAPTTLTSTASAVPLFIQNLYLGLRNKEIEVLQKVLNLDGVYPENIVSGYFGILTQKAVEKFQCKHNIVCEGTPETTGYGNVGPKTRGKITEVFGKE